MACSFQIIIGGKFAPLIGQGDEDMDINTMITAYNTAVTDAASEILGKNVSGKSRRSPEKYSASDERRDFKKKRYEAEGTKEYTEANKRILRVVKKDGWVDDLRFYVIFNNISVISGRRVDDY